MNRVLKVVFSRAKGMFVVVSELGRACTKGSLKSVLVAVPLVLAVTGAMAAAPIASGKYAVAQGEDSEALGSASVAIGYDSVAEAKQMTTAIGAHAKAKAEYSVALGSNTNANENGNNSIAIGGGADTDQSASTFALGSIAIGSGFWDSSTMQATNGAKSDGTFSVALGTASYASGEKSVALGAYSEASGDNVVSVGSSSLKRRIVNVAAGEANNDAVTVSQTQGALQAILGTGVTVGHTDGVFSVTTQGTGLGGTGKTTVHDAIDYNRTNIATNTNNIKNLTDDVNVHTSQINTINTTLNDKANVDLDNISEVGKGVIQSEAQSAISVSAGTGPITVRQNQTNNGQWLIDLTMDSAVTQNSEKLVSSGAVYSAVNTAQENAVSTAKAYTDNQVTNLQTSMGTKANFDLDNLTNAGKEVITGLVEVEGGDYVTVTKTEDTTSKAETFAVKVTANGTIASGDTGLVTGGVVYDEVRPMGTSYHYIANQKTSANLEALDAALFNALNSATGVNKSAWWGALGGSISSASADAYANNGDGFVTGKDVYAEFAKSNDKISQNTQLINTNKASYDNYVTTTNGRLDTAESKITANKQEFDNYVTTTNDRFNSVETLAGKHTTVYGDSSDSNLTVENTAAAGEAKNYLVTLKKDLKLDSIKLGTTATVNADGLTVGSTSVKDGAITTDKVSANQVTVGSGDKQIVMNGNEGTFKVGTNLTLDSSGKITGVAAGKVSADSTDAVNGSQLYETQQMIGQNASNIQTLNQQINKTYDKVQRVGAGAAALAALRPQDFSSEHPISGAVGLGHYDGKQAIAVGMYYRPTENFTVGFGASAAGNDDYMMNAGISYRFGGSGSQLRLSQSDINRKVVDLTDQNRALVAQIESSNIREEASAKRLNQVSKQLASTQTALKSTQSELKVAQKKAELSDQKLDMVMKELAALREEIQKMKQK